MGFILSFIVPILLGGFLASPFHRFKGVSGWLAAGTVTGLSSFTAVCFLFTLFGGSIRWLWILLTLALMMTFTVGIRWCFSIHSKTVPTRYSDSKSSRLTRLFSSLTLIALSVLIVLTIGEVIHSQENGLWYGLRGNYSDLPVHLHYIASFLHADNFPPLTPNFSGAPLRYPFLTDFYSAVLWFACGDMEWSLELPGLVLGISLLILFFQWITHLTSSVLAGSLASLLFFLNGSSAWYFWLESLFTGEKIDFYRGFQLNKLEGIFWANNLHAFWAPQRNWQFAFPLVIFLLAILFDAAKTKDRSKFTFVGILGGFIPLFHGHTIIALTIFGLIVLALYPSRHWILFLVLTALLWLPQVLYLAQLIGPTVVDSAGSVNAFIQLQAGAFGKESNVSWSLLKNMGPYLPLLLFGLWYLLKNNFQNKGRLIFNRSFSFAFLTYLFAVLVRVIPGGNPFEETLPKASAFEFVGVIPLLLFFVIFLIGFLVSLRKEESKHYPKDACALGIGALFIFLLGSTIQFTPWGADQIKVLIYAYLGALPVVSLFLVRMVRWRRVGLKPLVIVCFMMLTATGYFKLFYALREGGENGRIQRPDDLAVVEWIKEEVSKDALFFTKPTHVNPVYLSGRKIFMGHAGHAWTHGLPSKKRYREQAMIRKGETNAIPLIKQHGITHIVYSAGPPAKKPGTLGKAMNRVFFTQIGTPVYRSGRYEIFEVRPDLLEAR